MLVAILLLSMMNDKPVRILLAHRLSKTRCIFAKLVWESILLRNGCVGVGVGVGVGGAA